MEVSFKDLKEFQSDFEKKSKYKLMQGVLRKSFLNTVSANQNALSKLPFKFNYSLPESTMPLDQYFSGRCWIFAGLNVIRHKLIDDLKLDPSFQLSQAYICRCDKIEKCNAGMEYIYDLAKQGKDNSSLEYAALIEHSMGDGGTWMMFVNLVKKYGLIPKDLYPDNTQVKHTSKMNDLLINLVLKTSNDINTKMSRREFEEYKFNVLGDCYRVINMFLGNAPDNFAWAFKEKQVEKNFTPVEFYTKVVKPKINIERYVNVCHFPAEKMNMRLGVEYTHSLLREGDNVARDDSSAYYNMDVVEIKNAVWKSIRKGVGVWFAGDVTKYWLEKSSILDQNASNLGQMLDINLNMPKAAGLMTRTNIPNHAMMFTGCQKNEDRSGFERWKVENSHGKGNDLNGFVTMSDKWFDKYVVCAAVPIDCLSAKMKALVKSSDSHIKWLPFYSVLGTFAC